MIEDTIVQQYSKTHLSDPPLDFPFPMIQTAVQVGAIDRRGIISAVPHDLLLFLLLVLKEAEHCSRRYRENRRILCYRWVAETCREG